MQAQLVQIAQGATHGGDEERIHQHEEGSLKCAFRQILARSLF
jgi:hypothetical protein